MEEANQCYEKWHGYTALFRADRIDLSSTTVNPANRRGEIGESRFWLTRAVIRPTGGSPGSCQCPNRIVTGCDFGNRRTLDGHVLDEANLSAKTIETAFSLVMTPK